MSDTPRTDALDSELSDLCSEFQKREPKDRIAAVPDFAGVLTGRLLDFARTLERESATQAARIRTLTEALEPFAKEFQRRISKGHPDRQDWNKRMPGEWPVALDVTMEDGRRACAALSQE